MARGHGNHGHLYSTARWQRLRRAWLDAHPTCARCDQDGSVVGATVCDHVNGHPPGETEAQFWAGPFQSLCRPCHDGAKRAEEATGKRRGCDADGWPIDTARQWGRV